MAEKRRLDRIRAEDYLGDLAERSVADLRAMKADCLEEENDLSFSRRLLLGRIDILRDEVQRRHDSDGDGDYSDQMAKLSALITDHDDDETDTGDGDSELDLTAGVARRHQRIVPNVADTPQRRETDVPQDSALLNLHELDDDKLAETVADYTKRAAYLSELRRLLFIRIDDLQAEIVTRYKDGSADVSDWLESAS